MNTVLLCQFCGYNATKDGEEIFAAHMRNCITATVCERCRAFKVAHGKGKWLVCDEFVGPQPRFSDYCA